MIKITSQSRGCASCNRLAQTGLCHACATDLMAVDYLKITTVTGFHLWYVVGRGFDFRVGVR